MLSNALWMLGAVLVTSGLLLFMVWWGNKFEAVRRQAFAEAGRALGLALSAEGQPIGLQGTVGGVPIRVETVRVEARRSRVREVVRFSARPARSLPVLIVTERERSAHEAVPGHLEFRTGDGAFDARFTASAANAAEARGLLDSALRAELFSAASSVEFAKFDPLEVVLVFASTEPALRSSAWLERTVRWLAEVSGGVGAEPGLATQQSP